MSTLFQINVVANSGSTGRIAEGIAEAVINDEWICYTAYGRWGNPSKTYLYKIGSKWGVYFHYLVKGILIIDFNYKHIQVVSFQILNHRDTQHLAGRYDGYLLH